MSVTPSRLSNTTSFALRSRRMPAARCTSAATSDFDALCRDAVMTWTSGSRLVRHTAYQALPSRSGLDDPDADLGLHVRMQLHGDAIDAKRLDRLVQIDETAFDHQPVRGELLGDVRRGHGTEQLALLAHTRREGELHLLELPGESRGTVATRRLRGLESRPLGRDALQVARCRFVCVAARKQEVAGIAVLDRDDVPRLPEVLDGLSKNDFHKKNASITW